MLGAQHKRGNRSEPRRVDHKNRTLTSMLNRYRNSHYRRMAAAHSSSVISQQHTPVTSPQRLSQTSSQQDSPAIQHFHAWPHRAALIVQQLGDASRKDCSHAPPQDPAAWMTGRCNSRRPRLMLRPPMRMQLSLMSMPWLESPPLQPPPGGGGGSLRSLPAGCRFRVDHWRLYYFVCSYLNDIWCHETRPQWKQQLGTSALVWGTSAQGHQSAPVSVAPCTVPL